MSRRFKPVLGGVIAVGLAATLATGARADEVTLKEVVVTATLNKNPLDIAQPTTVMAGDELARQLQASLGETLARQPGVSSSYFGPTASRPVIRGLGGYRVQTLQDGIAMLDVSSLSDDHAVPMDPALASQIEVLKGPATLLYGSGASGGLINVVTHRIPESVPDDRISGFGELRYGSVADERAGAGEFITGTRTANGNDIAVHGDYFQSQSDAFDIPRSTVSSRLRQQLIDAGKVVEESIGTVPNSRSEAKGGSIGGSWLGSDATLGASASHYQSTYGIPVEAAAFIDMQQDRFDALGEWRLDDSWLKRIQIRGAYNDYTHTEFEAPGEPGTIFTQRAYEARLAFDHAFESWRGTFGAQITELDFKAEGDEALVPSSLTKSTGLFVLEERDFGAVTLNVGGRVERQTIEADDSSQSAFDGTAASAAGGTVWHLSEADALAFNLTYTSRHPQAVELFANGPHIAAARFEIGDANLDTEVAYTADLSWRRDNEEHSWLVNIFYNDYENFIYAAPAGNLIDDLPEINYRQSGAALYGYEFEFWTPLLEAQSGGSLKLRLMSDYVHGTREDGEPLPQIPAQRLGMGFHFEHSQWHAELEGLYNFNQDRVAVNELPTDSYLMMNADLSYHIKDAGHWLIFLRGTNLLNEEARAHTSSLKDLVPLPGRSFNAGVRISF